MKRGVFEGLFITALAYTVVVSAGMPARAHETVVYPVSPLEQRELDSLVDKARKTILGALRATGEELKHGRTDNDAVNDDYAVANADSGFSGEDSDFTDAGFADANNGFADANPGGGTDSADTVLTEWQYYGNCRITHYDAGPCCCGEWATGCTASGVLATTHHTVATGDDLPFGTELLINGEVYVVEDRGVDPYCVDIFVEDHLQALELGMYYTDVYVRW